MIILYLCFIGFPLAILILKVKAKEYDDPKLFIWIIIWIVACSTFWHYMGWYTWDAGERLFDPDFIWKN